MRYETAIIFRPLQQRPATNVARRHSQFRSTLTQSLELLDRELQNLGAVVAVLQLDCDESQLRADGWPRHDCRVNSSAVALSFECDRGYLTYPCDTYTHWHDNVRAIAKGLESLRAVDRYGITVNGEQYRGWKAITYRTAEFNTSKEAVAWLCKQPFVTAGEAAMLSDPKAYRNAIKIGKSVLHPDGSDPDVGRFQELLAAQETLDRHHQNRIEAS